MVAVRYLPDDRVTQVLPDDAFAHDGQITKQSMRAVTLAALAPRPGELLWDVGSGSGSIAIEWCRGGRGCAAVAFERDEQRRKRIAANAVAFGVTVDVRGEAPQAFEDARVAVRDLHRWRPHPAGAAGHLHRTASDRWQAGRQRGHCGIGSGDDTGYSRLGGELRRFQHYRGEPLGGFTGWRPAMPVTQWVVTKR